MGPDERAEKAKGITPTLAVRTNTAGSPKWYATWRDSEDTSVMRTVGMAHLERRKRPNPRTGSDDGLGSRRGRTSERWRQTWKRIEKAATDGALTAAQAQVQAQALVLVREKELDESEQAEQRRQRNAPVVFGVLMARYLEAKEKEHADGLLKWSALRDLRSSYKPNGRIGMEFHFLAPEQVDNARVDAWVEKLEKAGLSAKTRAKLRMQVGAVLTYGVQKQWITATPLVAQKRTKPKASGRLRFYTREQVELIARTMNEQDGELVRLAAYSGLRLGELLALTWEAVNFSRASIRVEESYTSGMVGLPKSGQVRTVPLADQAAAALERHARRMGDPSSGLVFPGERSVSGYQDPSALRRRWNAALSKIQEDDPTFPRLVLHSLRHAYGTALASGNVPLLTLREFMGHSDLKTTETYLHYSRRDDEAALVTRALGGLEVEDERVAEDVA